MISNAAPEHSFISHRQIKMWQFSKSCLEDIWAYRFALESFVSNNLKRRYRRSTIGFLWSLVSPLMTMSFMALVFSLLFHADIKTYTVYVFSGMLPWAYLSESAIEGSQCFINAESYLKKLFIPKIFFPMVSVATDTMNFFFSLLSLLIIALLCGITVNWTILMLPVVIGITFVFNLGIALTYGVSTVYFRDLPHILRITYQALFYLVPVVYPLERIPEQYRGLFLLNPFYYLVTPYRRIICEGRLPSHQEWLVLIGLAAFSLTVGLFLLMKRQNNIIYRL